MTTHNKLVRDNIPEIIRKDGKICTTKILDRDEMIRALQEKLEEEVQEFALDANPEELADILEVVFASGKLLGYSPEDLEAMRLAKRHSNGGFSKNIFLIEVHEPDNQD